MALLPVQTVGNAKFMRFKIATDGRVEREVYRKTDPYSHFSPKFLSFIFREGDLREVAEYIRS